jgi:hypothetical protein
MKTPLTGAYSGTKGFVVYRGSKLVYQVQAPSHAMQVAAQFLSFPQIIDGDLIDDKRRRVLWARCLLKVCAENYEENPCA